MKKIIYYFKAPSLTFSLLLLIWFPLIALNSGDGPHRNLKIKIEKESYVTIHGKTNTNQFHCKFTGDIYQDILSIHIKKKPGRLLFDYACLNLEVAQFDCGNKLINSDFYELLQSELFPNIGIELLEVNKTEKYWDNTTPVDSVLTGLNVSVAGITNSYTIPVQIIKEGQHFLYAGSLNIDIRDFDLTPPRKMLGLIVVKEEVRIEFFLKIKFLK